jgi:hypothetical protein
VAQRSAQRWTRLRSGKISLDQIRGVVARWPDDWRGVFADQLSIKMNDRRIDADEATLVVYHAMRRAIDG